MVSKEQTSPRRARQPEAKQARREAILDAAELAWLRTPYPELTMQGLAKGAGLAKGTLYLYFQTKEDLFLALLERHIDGWADDLYARLDAAPNGRPETVARLIRQSVEPRAPMRRLLALLGSVLESGLDAAPALRFKAHLNGQLQAGGARLAAVLNLPETLGARILLNVNALIVGWQGATEDSAARRAVLLDPELRPLAPDFGTELEFSLAALLRGLTPPQEDHP